METGKLLLLDNSIYHLYIVPNVKFKTKASELRFFFYFIFPIRS